MKRVILVLTFAFTLALSAPSLCAIGGVPLWTNIYTEPDNGFDIPTTMAVDGSGTVFVSGTSARPNSAEDDIATVAYSNLGQLQWTNRITGPGGAANQAKGMVVDANGRVILTGSLFGGLGYVWITLAYSSNGDLLWTNQYGSWISAQYDFPHAIACDTNSNVFVTGEGFKGTEGTLAVTVKYSSTGQPLWTNAFGEYTGGIAQANGVAVDQTSGNAIIVGKILRVSNDFQYFTIAYSNAGLPLWTNFYSNELGDDNIAVAVACDPVGNIFVTGYSEKTNTPNDSNFDYATIAYSKTGQALWTNRFDGPASGNDQPRALVVGPSGNVYVTGSSAGIGSDEDYATVACSNSGVPLWTNRYNGPGNYYDVAYAIAVDKSDNVFVTGSSAAAFASDFATLAYTSAGVPLWTNRYGGAGNSYDDAYAIAVDGAGNVFIAGEAMQGLATATDFVTIKYSSSIPSPAYLNYQKVNDKLRLTWTNAGFSLQSAPTCTGTFTNLPGATSPFTNPITGAQQFFRLISN